jgi:hypothetical protein
MSKIIKIENDCPAWCPYCQNRMAHGVAIHRIFNSNIDCSKICHYLPRSLSTSENTECTTKFIFKTHCNLKIIQK